uniref:Uncharacterized protein n=1 Tax=Anser brachyrhynchus TaxID=132585 RepID=A0A8B9CQH2_9AVES
CVHAYMHVCIMCVHVYMCMCVYVCTCACACTSMHFLCTQTCVYACVHMCVPACTCVPGCLPAFARLRVPVSLCARAVGPRVCAHTCRCVCASGGCLYTGSSVCMLAWGCVRRSAWVAPAALPLPCVCARVWSVCRGSCVWVCTCVCMRVGVHACVYMCVHACVCMHVCAYVLMQMCANVHATVSACMYVHVCVQLCACTCVCARVLCVRACAWKCACMCVHACVCACVSVHVCAYASGVPTSPPATWRVPMSLCPRVPMSLRPHVPVSPCPHVPVSPCPRVPAVRTGPCCLPQRCAEDGDGVLGDWAWMQGGRGMWGVEANTSGMQDTDVSGTWN